MCSVFVHKKEGDMHNWCQLLIINLGKSKQYAKPSVAPF